MINQIPHFLKEVIAFDNELSERKAKDVFEVPLISILKLIVEFNSGSVELRVAGKEVKVLIVQLWGFGLCHYGYEVNLRWLGLDFSMWKLNRKLK